MVDLCSTTILAYYICAKPMKNFINNAIHIFNEIIILTCTWSLLLFTDYVPDPVIRYDLGQYFLYVLGVNIATNIIVLIGTILHTIYSKIRL